jgi:hypothetical protein
MRTAAYVAVAASALALSTSGLFAQSVISAHSGVLNHYIGEVTIDGKAPIAKAGTFAEVKENQELQTQVGRAELLLTPGVFLRAGENSSIRMDSNKLANTKLSFLKGSAILDFVEVAAGNSVTISYQDYAVTFVKKGIYRFDSEPAELRVYSGEAVVTHGSNSVHLKDGRALPFTPALVAEKFDNRNGDELYRWAKKRSEYIAVANLSAARRASNGYTSNSTSSWSYNPYYGMYTFIPGSGMLCDPFAAYACYYSRGAAWRYYYPPVNSGGGGGGGYNSAYNSSGYFPNSGGYSSTTSTYSSNASTYSAAPSVSPSSGSYSSGASSGGFSGGGASSGGGGGFSGGGGGGGGASHGGGSAGGHGK